VVTLVAGDHRLLAGAASARSSPVRGRQAAAQDPLVARLGAVRTTVGGVAMLPGKAPVQRAAARRSWWLTPAAGSSASAGAPGPTLSAASGDKKPPSPTAIGGCLIIEAAAAGRAPSATRQPVHDLARRRVVAGALGARSVSSSAAR
jgi:hypothetical protein